MMGRANRFENFLTHEEKAVIDKHLATFDSSDTFVKELRNYLYQEQVNYELTGPITQPTSAYLRGRTHTWAKETLSKKRLQTIVLPVLFGILAFSISLPTAGQCLIGVASLTTPEAWLIAACIALVVTAAVAIPLAVTGRNKAELFASETQLIRSDDYPHKHYN